MGHNHAPSRSGAILVGSEEEVLQGKGVVVDCEDSNFALCHGPFHGCRSACLPHKEEP